MHTIVPVPSNISDIPSYDTYDVNTYTMLVMIKSILQKHRILTARHRILFPILPRLTFLFVSSGLFCRVTVGYRF